jgi:hypothetical protein
MKVQGTHQRYPHHSHDEEDRFHNTPRKSSKVSPSWFSTNSSMFSPDECCRPLLSHRLIYTEGDIEVWMHKTPTYQVLTERDFKSVYLKPIPRSVVKVNFQPIADISVAHVNGIDAKKIIDIVFGPTVSISLVG